VQKISAVTLHTSPARRDRSIIGHRDLGLLNRDSARVCVGCYIVVLNYDAAEYSVTEYYRICRRPSQRYDRPSDHISHVRYSRMPGPFKFSRWCSSVACGAALYFCNAPLTLGDQAMAKRSEICIRSTVFLHWLFQFYSFAMVSGFLDDA